MSGLSLVTNKDLFVVKHSVSECLSRAHNSSLNSKFERNSTFELGQKLFSAGGGLSDKIAFDHSTGDFSKSTVSMLNELSRGLK